MKMTYFVSGSSLLIAGWLVMTFFHSVSPMQYPKQRLGSQSDQARREPAAKAVAQSPKHVLKATTGLIAAETP
jgi:hypothetical protein